MTGDEREEIWSRIPTVKSSVGPTKAQVPKQVDQPAPYNGRRPANYVPAELARAFFGLSVDENEAETAKTAVLALQNREELSQDPTLSADAREANSQYASVIRKWLVNKNPVLDTSFVDHPEYLLDLAHSGYKGATLQSDTSYVLQLLSNMFSDAPRENLDLKGFADMTSGQMMDALNKYEGSLDKITDQISDIIDSAYGSPIIGYPKPDDTPEQMDDWILNIFGKEYGLDPKYTPHCVALTTNITDPPKWMYHMFDSLDIKV